MSDSDTAMAGDLSLDDLRREIDSIDDHIHDLLMRRTALVGKVGAVKQRASSRFALRPGREAQIIRRLVGRHRGPFPVGALVRIWRELLAAQVAVQGDYAVAIFAPEDVATYRDLGRDQFGAWLPMRKYQTVNQVVHDVWNGKVSIGILPFPAGERPDPWWRLLVASGDKVPKVIARLPFFDRPVDDGDRQSALAVASIDPERTGDDISLLAIERMADISRARMREDLIASGLDAEWLATWKDPDDDERTLHLLSVDDFVSPGDPRLRRFAERIGDAVRDVSTLGSYARPIVGPGQPSNG